MVGYVIQLLPPGRVQDGVTKLPFQLPLKPNAGTGDDVLLETYHGVRINVVYFLMAEVKRGRLQQKVSSKLEIYVESKSCETGDAKPKEFSIAPDTIRNPAPNVTQFKFLGCLDSTICKVWQPLSGKLTIQESYSKIKSIELQLIRVEIICKNEATGYVYLN